jgi:hypothetical protein
MLIKSLFCFFLISCVFSQLPGLYTRDREGLIKDILNKHSSDVDFALTKQYNGGIYVCELYRDGVTMTPLHKQMVPNYLSPKAHPGQIDRQSNNGQPMLNTLYTRKKNGYYTHILRNKDLHPTRKYGGGIYYRNSKGQEVNVHKPPDQNYFRTPTVPNININQPMEDVQNIVPIPEPPPLPKSRPQPINNQPPFNLNQVIRTAKERNKRVEARTAAAKAAKAAMERNRRTRTAAEALANLNPPHRYYLRNNR